MPSRFQPKSKPKLINPILSGRLKRTIRAHNEVHQKYIPDRKGDKLELETSLYKQRYPDLVERELGGLIRVKVPRGRFELDPEGTVDEKGTVTEALVYSVTEKVVNPNPDPKKEEDPCFAWCTTKMGVYQKPLALVRKDDLGNPVYSKVTGSKAMFYIPFTKENVKKVLEEFNYQYKNTVLAIATREGGDSWYGSHTYSVFNLDEWLHSNFDDALGANQAGFLKDKATKRVVEEGAVNKYLMDKTAKREQAEKQWNEFREKQKSKTKGK